MPSQLTMSELQTCWDVMGNHSFREPSVDLNAKSFNPAKLKQKEILLSLLFISSVGKRPSKEDYRRINRFQLYLISALSWPNSFRQWSGFHAVHNINIVPLVEKMLMLFLKGHFHCSFWNIGKYVIMTFLNLYILEFTTWKIFQRVLVFLKGSVRTLLC